MIKGGLLYALKKKFWEMLSPLIVGPKPTKETQLEAQLEYIPIRGLRGCLAADVVEDGASIMLLQYTQKMKLNYKMKLNNTQYFEIRNQEQNHFLS